jgi:hypothetical protein
MTSQPRQKTLGRTIPCHRPGSVLNHRFCAAWRVDDATSVGVPARPVIAREAVHDAVSPSARAEVEAALNPFPLKARPLESALFRDVVDLCAGLDRTTVTSDMTS